ncbi:MAG: glycosyltransferase [Verrucomicrobia bacterium]|nr:glycosyltransferase [Verrucomicrobiota bacterium]
MQSAVSQDCSLQSAGKLESVPNSPRASDSKSAIQQSATLRHPERKLSIIWEGSQFVHHSLALINRELCLQLIEGGHDLSILPFEPDQFGPEADPRFGQIAGRVRAPLARPAHVHLRHQWPFNPTPPQDGHWVIIQPWEFGCIPKDWVAVLRDRVDEIWVPSAFVRDCYIQSGIPSEKVYVVPNGTNPDRFHPNAPPLLLPKAGQASSLPGSISRDGMKGRQDACSTARKFRFLFVGGTIRRKGPDLALNAYLKSFTAADNVCLVVKDFGANTFYQGQTLEAQIRQLQSHPNAPEIVYLNQDLAPEQMPGLYTACDCLVHPYRGEGFGLPILEAMACGLPVIVTAGGAADDFATEEFAYRIPARRQSIGTKVGDLELAGQGWLLEPDLEALSNRMKFVASHPAEARLLGQRASVHVRSKWTWTHAAAAAEKRLQALAARTENPTRLRPITLPDSGRAAVNPNRGEQSVARFPSPCPSPQGEGRLIPAAEKSGRGEGRGEGEGDAGLTQRPKTETATPQPAIEVPAAGLIGSLKKAQDFAAQKKYLKAWKAALEAIKLRPFHPDAYLQMIEIALSADDERQAFLCAERLIRMTPNWEMARRVFASLKTAAEGKRSQINWTPLPKWPDRPRLSVCLIAKDEEDNIGRCLASVEPIASQIVVVDTGSKDRTVEIARQHGAEIYRFDWNDNFADARNAGHEHARGDWVLILDADEELPKESHEKLSRDMAATNVLGYRIPICNIHEAADSVTYVPRLFRNAPALFFVGRVHEQIYASVIARKAEWGMDATMGTATIMHYGYDPGLVKRKQKIQRNLRLMERAVQELPNEAALLMNYGLDLVNDGRLEEGLEKYRHAFRIMAPHPAGSILPEVRERLLTIYGVHALKAELFGEVLDVMTSRLAGDAGPTASMHFLAAVALMRMKRAAEAIPHLEACLAKRDAPTLTPPCHQVFKAGPHHLLAQCCAVIGENERAEAHFKQALVIEPETPGVLHDYAHFLHRTDRSLEALQTLHGIMAKGINDEHLWHLGSFISASKPEFAEFSVDWTEEALKHFPQHAGIRALRGEALLKGGRFSEALPFFQNSAHAQEPSARAAVLICQFAEGQTPSLAPSENEAQLSVEFVNWYRRLLAARSLEGLKKINSQIAALRKVLPRAAAMLDQALQEADPS